MDKNIKALIEVNYCPPAELMNRNVDIDKAKKFPIDKAASLGVAFRPLTQLINLAKGGEGGSGFYYVNTYGKKMFKSGDSYIGTLPKINGSVGGGTAKLTYFPVDPTMMFMAAAIMTVEKKLDVINEAQKDMLAFLELKEEAKMKGNLNALADVLNNYKFNWENEKYKNNKHILVQEIKRDTEQSIILYNEKIAKILNKNSLIYNDREIKSKTDTITAQLNDYQLALYVFSFSSFLEVMLLENFDSGYLNSISDKILEYSDKYKKLYDKSVEKIQNDSNSSIQGKALRGLSKLSGGTGKIVEKIPLISRTQLDENLIKAGNKLLDKNADRINNITRAFADRLDYVTAFVENIKALDSLYNQSAQLMFDSENIYIAAAAE